MPLFLFASLGGTVVVCACYIILCALCIMRYKGNAPIAWNLFFAHCEEVVVSVFGSTTECQGGCFSWIASV